MQPTADYSLLVLATQYSFYAVFSGIFASAIYFHMERNNLTLKYSTVASLCMMIVAIAAINYSYMKQVVGLDGKFASLSAFTTSFRYADWILTTPLILVVLVVLTNSHKSAGLIFKLVTSDIIMILLGYIGEVSINKAGGGTVTGWVCFVLSCFAFVYILITVYGELSEAAADMNSSLRGRFNRLQTYILVVWIVYPIGYLVTLLGFQNDFLVVRELIYCIADLIAKAGFCMMAVGLAKQLSLEEVDYR
jgi:bacteriorhodopsin